MEFLLRKRRLRKTAFRDAGALRRDDNGAIAVLAALTTPLLLAAAALGAEGGYAYFKHISMQTASDMAAISGAVAYAANANPDVAKFEAAAVAASLGYVDGVNGTTVAITSPSTGAFTVSLSLAQQPMLAKSIFTKSFYTIAARSTARAGSGSAGCILALNTTASPAITYNGNTQVTLVGCSVYSNSGAANSINNAGSASMVADDVYAVGGISASNLTATLHPNSTPLADPYAYVKAATINCPATPLPSVITGPATIQPGTYCSGLKLKSGNITMAAGTYYVVGGAFEVQNAAVVDATSGVTIVTAMYNNYLYSSSITGGATFNLTAPTFGEYAGIAFYADRSIPTSVNITQGFTGQANMTVNGAIYAPTSTVTYAGGSNGAGGCTQIVAQTIKLTGGTTLSSVCSGRGTKTIGGGQTALVD